MSNNLVFTPILDINMNRTNQYTISLFGVEKKNKVMDSLYPVLVCYALSDTSHWREGHLEAISDKIMKAVQMYNDEKMKYE